MTDVGSVSVGVDVNGTGLGEKLAAAIRAAVIPAINELNAELKATNKQLDNVSANGFLKIIAGAREASESVQKLNRELDQLGSHADNKATTGLLRLTAAARDAAQAVDRVGNASIEAAAVTEASAEAMAKAYDRVARAAERSADRQVAAAARVAAANEAAAAAGGRRSPQQGVPTPRNPGGGGGGGGGGFISSLTGPIPLNLAALSTTALAPVLLGVTNLTGAVQQLGQAGILLPGIFAAVGSSFATAKIATLGMGDAVKDLYKALGSGDPKELKKANAEIALLPKNVQDTVHAFGDLFPALKDVRETLANNMFDGVGQQIRDVGAKDIPIFKTGLGQISTAWNGTIKTMLGVLGSDSTGGFLTRIFGNTAEAQTIANAAIAPITHAFGTLAATGSDFLPRLAKGLDGLATRFDNFITKSAANGDLDRWINEGIDAAKNLGESFLNIGKIITDLTAAAGGDGGFLKALKDGTTSLHNFLSSADGQNKLKSFFAEAREEWAQWKPILVDLAQGIGQVFNGLHDWGSTILPIFGGVTDFLIKTPGLVSGLVTGFLAFRTLGGILSTFGGGANTAAGGVGNLLGKLGGLQKLGGIAGIAALLSGNQFINPSDGSDPSVGSKLGGAALNIGGGALAGFSFGGPVGAAFGAAIGAAVSLAEAVTHSLNEARDRFQAQLDRDKDPNRPGNPDTANAVTGRDRILQPSLNNPTIPATLLPRIQAGLVPGFAVNPQGQVINTQTGQVVPLPGNLTTLPPGVPLGPPSNFVPPPLPPPPLPKPPPIPAPVVPVAPPSNTIAPRSLSGLLGADDSAPTDLERQSAQIQAALPAQGVTQVQTQITAAIESVGVLSRDITALPNGSVKINDTTPEVIERLKSLGLAVTQLPGGTLKVTVQYIDPLGYVTSGGIGHGVGLTAIGAGAGHSGGGVIPGYSPGIDNVWHPMSGGEGILIPEAVRGIGGSAGVYAINSMFRPNLSRQGYADGGVTPGGLPGLDPGAPVGDPVVGLLTQIRDLLAGSGAGDTPLKGIRKNTESLTSPVGAGLPGQATAGTKIGPFGTPLKQKGDPAYRAAAAAIQALGGDPEEFLGTDPTLTSTALGGTATGAANTDAIAALTQFARTGIANPGVDPTSTVARAILTARNKKKGGLGDDQIADLVNSTLTTGTFSGQLDATNTPLIQALLKGAPKLGGLAPAAGAGATSAGLGITTSPIAGPGLGQGTAGITPVFVVNFPGQAVTDIPGLPGGANSSLQTGIGAGGGAAAGPGGATNFLGKSIVDAATGAVGSTGADLTGSFIDALASGTDFKIGTPTAASTPLSRLLQQGNPLAGAAAFGLDVPDYTRDGGTNGTVGQQGQRFDAKGRMYSDAGSLIDRTMTDLSAQIKASFDQLKSVINQVKDNTAKEVLAPLMKTAVTEGIAAMSNATNKKIGEAQGEAAAAPIAVAVSKASSAAYQSGVSAGSAQSSAGGGAVGAVGGVLGNLFDEGGLWESGTYGTNLSGSVERVLDPVQTQLFDAGLLGGWNQQLQQQHQAAADGVDATSTVGADFFGVSQIPVIGAIVNLIIGVLLKLIGVQIDARNTLTDIGKDAREFRGAFTKFDATGRLINDTSAISDRSSTSDQEAADERIRILKLVIEGLIKFIIEKIIIPIGSAVANAAISAGGAAAGAAINTQAPGAGGIVSSLIDSAGQAGVGIVADLASSFTEAATPVLTDSLFGAIQSFFPGLSTGLFGGGLLSMITNPLQALLSPLTGGIAGLFATLLGGLTFDEGGVASGVGLMPKATIRPERVLSPSQTQSFDRLVTALERGGRNGNQITVHAPFTVAGGAQGAEQAHAKLLSLLGGA